MEPAVAVAIVVAARAAVVAAATIADPGESSG